MTGIKPFELSLWGDRLNNNQFEEYRVCTVASDTMDSSVGAFDVKLVTKINGDNQLTFSMYYQFIDTITGEITKNEIAELLCNEAKLKLHYDGKWYDFVIKDVKKDSSKYTYNFTAKDANIQELSKNGYNLSLTEVQSNNVGTVIELGSTVLADTDWIISEDSDTLYETAEELVLLANTVNTINAKKLIINEQTGLITESQLEIPSNKLVYVFYSNLENKNTRIQFLYRDTWQKPNIEDGVIKDSTWVECYCDISKSKYTKSHSQLDIKYPSFLTVQDPVELGLKAKKHVYNVFNQYSPTLERYVYKYTKFLIKNGTYQTDIDLIGQRAGDPKNIAWAAWDFVQLEKPWNENARLPLTLSLDCQITGIPENYVRFRIGCGSGGQANNENQADYNGGCWEFFSNSKLKDDQYWPSGAIQNGTVNVHFEYTLTNLKDAMPLLKNKSKKVRIRVDIYTESGSSAATRVPVTVSLSNVNLIGGIYARDFSTKRDIPVLYQDVCTGGRNIKSLDGWSVTFAEAGSLSNEYEYDATEGTQSYLRWTKKSGNVLCNSGIFDNRKYIGTIVGGQEWLVEVTYKGSGASDFKPQLVTKTNVPIILDAEGKTYTHFAWANSSDGEIDFSTSNNTQKQYIGVYTDNNSTDSTDPSKYSWSVYDEENPYSIWITKLWKFIIPSETWPIISEREFNLDEKVQLQFVQSTDDTYVDIKKCSLFRSMGQDEDGNYYTPDNISKLINTEDKITYYYYNWEDVIGDNRITDKSELKLQAQADSTSESVETYIPVYTCEKTRAVTVEKSNYFNAIQSICESFKCWADFDIQRDENGKITNKQIIFKEYINHPNYAGFKYGLNLSGITRTIKSDQIVTKLLVQPNNNQFAPNKVCTIQQAGANPTADTFIYDMRYYVNKKMLDALKWDDDLYVTEWDAELASNDIKGYYPALKYYNKKLLSISDALATASGALSEAEGRLSIAENGKKSAEDTLVKKLPEAIQKIPKTIKIDDNSSRDVWLLGSGQSQMDWAWKDANHTQVKNNTSSGDSYSKGTNEVWRIAINHAPKNGSYGLTDIGLTVNETFVTDATDKLSGCGLDGITLTSGEKYIYGAFFRCENQKERYKYYLALTSVAQNLEAINDGEWHFYSTEEEASNSGARLFIGTYPYEDKAGDRNLPVSFMCPILLLKEDWNTYVSPLLKSRDYYINELPKAQEEVDKINKRIESLKLQYNDVLKKKLALNKKFFTKYKRFIQEGTWSNDKCIDPNLYYNDALVTLSNSSLPKVSYDIKVTDISGLEEYSDFHYRVGDETTIQDPDFFGWELDGNLQPTNIPKRETIIVSEATYNLQNPSKNTLKVQTYKTQFNDLFNQITASVQSVTYAQGGFERAAEFMRAVNEEKSQFITNALNNTASVLQHGPTVTADNTGIRLQDPIEGNKMIHLAGGGISLSNDGGKNWRTSITADGITADVITSGVVNTSVLRIMNGNDSTFMWDSTGLTAYYFESQSGSNRTININPDKGVRFNRFGIYGTDKLKEITETLKEEEVVNKSTFALTWDGLKVSGNNAIIKIGKIEKTGSNTSKIFDVIKGNASTFFIDANGDVSLVGTITATGGQIGGWTIKQLNTNYGAALYYPSTESNGQLINGMGFCPSSGDSVCIWAGYKNTGGDPWHHNNGEDSSNTWDKSCKFYVTASGKMVAKSGTVGGWTIDDNSLSCGTLNSSGGAKISTADFSGIYAGASSSINNWRMLIGTKFGVTSDGAVYATTGKIGSWELTNEYLKGVPTVLTNESSKEYYYYAKGKTGLSYSGNCYGMSMTSILKSNYRQSIVGFMDSNGSIFGIGRTQFYGGITTINKNNNSSGSVKSRNLIWVGEDILIGVDTGSGTTKVASIQISTSGGKIEGNWTVQGAVFN